jgi:hypothetical protein
MKGSSSRGCISLVLKPKPFLYQNKFFKKISNLSSLLKTNLTMSVDENEDENE